MIDLHCHILLLETPYGPLTSTFESLVFDHVMLTGLTVLLAHPERSPSFQQDPKRLAALTRQGVVLQVTAPALLTRRSRSASRRLAKALLSEGLALKIGWEGCGERPSLVARAGVIGSLNSNHRYSPG